MSNYEFFIDRSEYCLSINNTIRNLFESKSNSDSEHNDVSRITNEAFMFLIGSIHKLPNFSLENKLDFLLLETCFFNTIQTAFKSVKNTANSADVVSIDIFKEYLESIDNEKCQYFLKIHEVIKSQFDYWVTNREKLKKRKWNPCGNRIQFCSFEHASKIRELTRLALDIIPTGELANRLALIADLRIIYNLPWTLEMRDDVEEIINDLPSYKNRTKKFHYYQINAEDAWYTFIKDTHSDQYLYQDPDGYSYDIFYGFDTLPFYNDNEQKFIFSEDDVYSHIMSFPAHINTNFQTIEEYAISIERAHELKKRNDMLLKAQNEKKQIIAEFAHTYINMQATTLQDIGTELLGVDDELFHEWGKKIMVEYAIKQNLTKEVEMLKLQFEDQSSALIQKLQDSISNDGKNISDLVSDSLQRCFMSLLYGETSQDKSKRNLFWGTDDFAERRKALQESFEEKVLVGEEKALSWLDTNHILNISLEISGIWRTLRFEDGGYAALLLTNWITELLTNAIKYADKSKTIILSFAQIDEMLSIKIQNIKEPSVVHIHGTQQGVSSIIASVCRLNQAVNCDKGVEIKNDEADAYKLQLFLSSKVISG